MRKRNPQTITNQLVLMKSDISNNPFEERVSLNRRRKLARVEEKEQDVKLTSFVGTQIAGDGRGTLDSCTKG
jgi:hypothetical protein